MRNEDRALNNLLPEQETSESIDGDSPVVTTSSGTQQPTERESNETPPVSSHSTDPLRELTASPGADPNPQSAVTAGTQIQNHTV